LIATKASGITAGDPEGRYRVKWQLVRNLYQAGYSADELREAFRLIDWMMKLNQSFAERFSVELAAFEKGGRHAIHDIRGTSARGTLAKGRGCGGHRTTAKHKFGKLPRATRRQLRALTSGQLRRLSVLILDFQSMRDVSDWLEATAAPEPTNGSG
jgi:hypothetical protein